MKCPLCRAPRAFVTKDRSYEDGLKLVLVKCNDFPCCAWQGAFTTAEEHEAGCEVPIPMFLAITPAPSLFL